MVRWPILFSFLCVAGVVHAAVNDVFPSDYVALKPGDSLITLYAYDREQIGPYANGAKVMNAEIASHSLAARVTRGFRTGDTTLAAIMVLPGVDAAIEPPALRTAFGGDARGAMDMRLGLTAWLINDREKAHYLGISGMLVAPTGRYDEHRALNPGENRWKYILYGGWQRDITPRLLFELAPEYVRYGDNDDYLGGRRLEQRDSWALTGYLRYRAAPALHLHVGAQINRGGETRIDGVDQHNPANNPRVMAGATFILPAGQQVIVRAARDTRIENGFRANHELALRYQKLF
jgi:hypothetical protein